jgi:hypothetical protein
LPIERQVFIVLTPICKMLILGNLKRRFFTGKNEIQNNREIISIRMRETIKLIKVCKCTTIISMDKTRCFHTCSHSSINNHFR